MTPRLPKRTNRFVRDHRAITFLFAVALLFLRTPLHGRAQAPSPSPAQASAPASLHPGAEPRLIEITADRDSRYKISGLDKPVITLNAGQQVRLRITAVKAKNRNRDGSIHGFTLLRSKDRTPVSGWDFLLMPGVQDFLVVAPSEPGDYQAVCTVICSSGHEQMNMKVVVVAKGG